MAKNTLFGIQKQQLKHLSKKEFEALKELSHLSKNMFNVAIYNIRQHYFLEKKFLSYESNYKLCKSNENYALLNCNSAQQVMKVVDRSFKSFFKLLKKAKNGTYNYKDISLPRYLEKDGFFNLIFAEFNVNEGFFNVPMSSSFRKENGNITIKVPSNLSTKKIKEIRICPKSDATFFEIQYVYEIESSKEEPNKKNALALDLGVNNLATCVTNSGKAFIIDGKRLKSINAYTNKTNTKLQRIKDKQKIIKTTKKQKRLWEKRNQRINDYMSKSARLIINYCRENDIGTLILGYNKNFQKEPNMKKKDNQNFVNIPFGQLREKLNYLCERHNIELVEQEESYTSKADFFSNDFIPTYGVKGNHLHTFSGYRAKRGLYKSKTGRKVNADINGALNIMRKSNSTVINLKNLDYMSPQKINVS